MKECDGVFEGGGVRGIGHVGAACVMEQAGYRFCRLAGSSAGAIVAALLAAGYDCGELKREMGRADYRRMRGRDRLDRLGTLGKGASLLLHLGIYDTVYLGQWVRELLQNKGVETFGDLKGTGRQLKITASDVTARKLLIFPDSLMEFGRDPDSFPVWEAVRMSAGIPIYFEPCRLSDRRGRTHLIVDGGLLSNYPIWLFDGRETKRPVFGFRFCSREDGDGTGEGLNGDGSAKGGCDPGGGSLKNPSGSDAGNRRGETCPEDREPGTACLRETQGAFAASRPGFLSYLQSIVSTSLDAIDNSRMEAGDRERSILIPATVDTGTGEKKIGAADFSITEEEQAALFQNGERAARRFLETWSFRKWKQAYR